MSVAPLDFLNITMMSNRKEARKYTKKARHFFTADDFGISWFVDIGTKKKGKITIGDFSSLFKINSQLSIF